MTFRTVKLDGYIKVRLQVPGKVRFQKLPRVASNATKVKVIIIAWRLPVRPQWANISHKGSWVLVDLAN